TPAVELDAALPAQTDLLLDAAPVTPDVSAAPAAVMTANHELGSLFGLPDAVLGVSEASTSIAPPSQSSAPDPPAPDTPLAPVFLSTLTSPAEPAATDPASDPEAARGPPSKARTATNSANTQLFYIDLDGATGVEYDGPVYIPSVDVPAFTAP